MSRISRSANWLFLFLALAVAPTVLADSRSQDEAAIKNLIESFTAHWHNSDAHGLSMFWISDGDFVNPDGAVMKGRQEIEGFYAKAFSIGYAGSTATATVDGLRFLKADLAIVDGEFDIAGAVTSDHVELPAERGRYTTIVKKEDGRWWIVSNREMEPPNRSHKN